ncbi:hypothetical protein K2X30_01580 [bacterium]|jgi:hypothetical protein|nr:hypothetical protein [bacterium]
MKNLFSVFFAGLFFVVPAFAGQPGPEGKLVTMCFPSAPKSTSYGVIITATVDPKDPSQIVGPMVARVMSVVSSVASIVGQLEVSETSTNPGEFSGIDFSLKPTAASYAGYTESKLRAKITDTATGVVTVVDEDVVCSRE